MKVLTAAQMREVDRRTIELGIPGIVLMENAGHRVAEFLPERFAPLRQHDVTVLCGKGNNGGDGMVVARQLWTHLHPRSLHVALLADPGDLRGDAAENLRMLRACGCAIETAITPEMERATLVIDALLGTGLRGPATGAAAEWIRRINTGFPHAAVVAVDLPSGMQTDTGTLEGDVVDADYTVTFTAPKPCQVLSPAAERCGGLRVAPIGSPASLWEHDAAVNFALSQPEAFRDLFAPRVLESNKGLYGHVLVVAGARGKTGAAAMSGMGALRAGAGLVTIATAESALSAVAAYAPELMTTPLPETADGAIAARALDVINKAAIHKTVLAIGPGIGTDPETVQVVRRLYAECPLPMVVDADALNVLAGSPFSASAPRVLTPHPGEMGRLASLSTGSVQADRAAVARTLAQQHSCYVVLKGHRTVIASPGGLATINPTSSPALATGGTGDVLTGMIAGLIAQFPERLEDSVLAAVYLHGRCGELGAAAETDKTFIATDIFRYLPSAMREVAAGLNPTLV